MSSRKRKFAVADSAAARFTAKRKARRTFRRPSPSTTPVVYVGRGPVAPKTVVTLRYHDTWQNAALKPDYVYRLNSIYDPDAQIGGHQPMGRDQYATFYNRYRVTACAMTLWVTPTSNTTSYKIVILGDNQAAAASGPFPGIEQRGATVHLPLTDRSGPICIRRKWLLRNITGVSEKEYQDDRFQALMSTDPAEVINLHIMASYPQGTDLLVGEVTFNLRLDYTVEMFDPLELASS